MTEKLKYNVEIYNSICITRRQISLYLLYYYMLIRLHTPLLHFAQLLITKRKVQAIFAPAQPSLLVCYRLSVVK